MILTSTYHYLVLVQSGCFYTFYDWYISTLLFGFPRDEQLCCEIETQLWLHLLHYCMSAMVYYISFCVWQFIRLLNFTMCICGIFNAILINIILWICIESSCGMYGMLAVYFYVIYIHVIHVFLFLQGTRTIPIFSLYIPWTLQSLILFFELYCKLGSFVIIYTCIFVHKCTLIFYMQ